MCTGKGRLHYRWGSSCDGGWGESAVETIEGWIEESDWPWCGKNTKVGPPYYW